jgi:hypothetical protein
VSHSPGAKSLPAAVTLTGLAWVILAGAAQPNCGPLSMTLSNGVRPKFRAEG